MRNLLVVLSMVLLFTMSLSAQKNKFLLDPSEIEPLQAGTTEYQPTKKWDDVRIVESGTRSTAFPDGYKPLLEVSTRIWDVFCLTAKLPTVTGYTYTAMWVDNQNFIMQEGLNFTGKLTYVGQMYCGIRAWQNGAIVEQKLFPAAEAFIASYGANDDFAIVYNSKEKRMYFNASRFIGRGENGGTQLHLNEFIILDSFFVSDQSSKDIVSSYSQLQKGTYRTSISYAGQISQQSYLVLCDQKFNATVVKTVKNSCPDFNNGSLHVSSVTGGNGFYKLVLWWVNPLLGKEEALFDAMFNPDNKGLTFDGLQPGQYRVEVKDVLIGVAWDDFYFTLVAQDSACECSNLLSQLQAEKKILQEKVVELELEVLELQEIKFLTITLERGNTTSLFDLQESEIEIYPNPTVNFIRFKTADDTYLKDCIISIYSAGGALAQTVKINGEDIDVSLLASGTYLIKLSDGSQIKTIRKFVKL